MVSVLAGRHHRRAMEKSGKCATLVRTLPGARKTKNRGKTVLERIEFLFRALPALE